MNGNNENRISFYRSPINDHQIPEKDPVSLEWVYNYLLNNEGAKEKTNGLRELKRVGGDDKEYKFQNLESVTFGGVFDYRGLSDKKKLQRLNKKGLLSPSGYVTIDIDHLSLLGPGKLEELRENFVQDKDLGLRLIFVSPGGDGLKLVCKSLWGVEDSESYEIDYFSLLGYLHERYNIPYFVRKGEDYIQILDKTPDINRACYLCHDSGALLLPDDDSSLFNSDEHIFPEVEVLEDRRKEKGEEVSLPRLRPEIVSSTDWRSFVEDRLLPACFDRMDQIFPSMDFQRAGGAWKSPYKLDGSPAKNKRRDKTVITQRRPDRLLEQGGGNIGLIDYFMTCNHITDFSEARKELSRICGLEQEEEDLRRKTAQSLNGAGREPRKRETGESPTGGDKPLQEADFAYYLTIPPLSQLAKEKREGIETPYTFEKQKRGREKLVLRSGALTLVCGKSSHGKSKFIQNLALQISEGIYNSGGGESVLFLTYEEELSDVLLQFANMFVGEKDLSRYDTPNTEVLRDYYETGKLNKCPESKREGVLRKLNKFNSLRDSGSLRVFYTDLFSQRLSDLVRFLSTQVKLKAVFVDYAQLLYREGNRKERNQELKDICNDLRTCAIETGLPIILSAQLNRATPNPLDMSEDNIADSADLTRYANTIVCLWNSSFDNVTDKRTFLDSQEYQRRLDSRGFKLGEEGKIYAKITKNRGGTSNIETVLDFEGETGRIFANDTENLFHRS